MVTADMGRIVRKCAIVQAERHVQLTTVYAQDSVSTDTKARSVTEVGFSIQRSVSFLI